MSSAGCCSEVVPLAAGEKAAGESANSVAVGNVTQRTIGLCQKHRVVAEIECCLATCAHVMHHNKKTLGDLGATVLPNCLMSHTTKQHTRQKAGLSACMLRSKHHGHAISWCNRRRGIRGIRYITFSTQRLHPLKPTYR